jgi:hypothetical protein
MQLLILLLHVVGGEGFLQKALVLTQPRSLLFQLVGAKKMEQKTKHVPGNTVAHFSNPHGRS